MKKLNKTIKFTTLIIVLISTFTMCKRKETNHYVITGKLENVNDSFFIAATEIGDSLRTDTIKISKDGEFKIAGQTDTLSFVSLIFENSTATPYVFVNKGWNVNVKGSIKSPDLIQVKGGDVNDNITAFKEEVKNLLQKRTNILEDRNHSIAIDSIVPKHSDVQLMNTDFDLDNKVIQYVKDHPDRISSVFLIYDFFRNPSSLDRLTEALKSLRGKAVDFPMTAKLEAYESYLRKSSVGAFVPMIYYKDNNGEKFMLRDLNEKLIILTFLSEDANINEKLIDNIIKDAKQDPKKDVALVFVVQQNYANFNSKKFDNKNIRFLLADKEWASSIYDDFNIKSLPSIILISPKMKILERNVLDISIPALIERYAPDVPKKKTTNKNN